MDTETEKPVFDKNNPFPATVLRRYRLNPGNPKKETIHVEVSLSGSGLSYSCGDSLAIFPENDPARVRELLEALGFSGEEEVLPPKSEAPVSLHEALSSHVSLASPTKKFLQALDERVTDAAQREQLDELLKATTPEDLKAYLADREFVDLVEEFSSARFTPQDLVNQLRRLVPRLYSIASSPVLYPDEVHLTIAVVRYRTNNRDRIGVASTYLAERIAIDQPRLRVFIAKSHFGLPPEPGRDAIMVGPGTGIAPFRAFIQDRVATGDPGRNWLFFGDQHREHDYLYGEEFEKYHHEGKLQKLSLAFSRDQEKKVYVQDRLLENGAEVHRWLEDGAYFFVCGDAQRMAKDVDAALHRIYREHGGLSEEAAAEKIKALKKEKRYQRDVY